MPDTPAQPFRVAAAQLAPVLRDTAGNARRIRDAADQAGAALLVTPELSLSGYDLGDAVHGLARPARPGSHLADAEPLAGAPGTLLLGMPEAAAGGPYNSAVALAGGRVEFRHRKLYLPTYGMFDEARWFGRGSALETWRPAPGWLAGVLVCEDFWHPGLVYVLASRGIDLLLVQAAAPGRGVWAGGEQGAFGSADVWERMARTTAQLYGIYVVLVNRVGVEGGVTFAGGSLIVGPDGEVITRADDHSETVIAAELDPRAVRQARIPYAHARDDDPGLVLRELARSVGAGGA
jgi:NAD+ synthase (glutamine-hydrolysing)